MSRSRTRCKPSTGAGSRSTAGCCLRQRLSPRRPTTHPWSSTSATRWGCGSRRVLVPIRASGRSGKFWVSTRGAHINLRRGELAVQFQAEHGRPPTPVEALQLAQQATLETRNAKHEPRSLAEQRSTWLNEAAAVLGGGEAVASMVRTALTPPAKTATIVDARWVAQSADQVLAAIEERRSTWQ